ncbi:hypothetical protein [Ruminococcus gauvreauii]|uniref:Uncharacterized protein n=1 Tax=Ruminococcus gauvreauii TaxID=438033 RepID=A0ABY5VBZ9_9FIRM|nr:hypothetical protein [Ruminococcus gauvreauii]UWP58089.1 hypothetical protein NQ502_11875 [Ruminococcus gauvreauii]
MNQSEENRLFSGILAALTSAVFFTACLKIPALSAFILSAGNINLIVFAGTVILFCLSFLLFYRIFRFRTCGFLQYRAVRCICFTLFAIGTLLFLTVSFLMEGNLTGGVSYKYVWHNLPLLLVIVLTVTACLVFFSIWRFREISVRTWILGLFYSGLTMLITYTFYTPNIFGRGQAADTAHGHAYFNSIYNVFHGSAYTEYTTSIYGHYALFYKLPLKVLGGNFLDFMLITALIGGLCFLCSFLTLHLMVENTVIRILGCIAMTLPILSMRGGYYWQVWPHRILFPAVLLLYGAFCLRLNRMNRLTCVLGYVLCLAGVVWNTESGMICAAAWAALWILRYFVLKKQGPLSFIKTAAFHCAAIAAVFFGAYGLVNLYNIMQDSSVNSLREFLFPLMSASYMTDLLHLDLPLYPAAYMGVLLLFFIAAAWGISSMRCFHTYAPSTPPVLPAFSFFLSVISLGQLTYFMNRPAYHNLDVCHLQAVLFLCILAACTLPQLRKFSFSKLFEHSFAQLGKISFCALSLSVLLVLTLGTTVQYAYNSDIKKNYHDMAELQEFADTIASEIPPHTYGFGVSVSEIYSLLGWSTNCFTLDFTDLSVRPQVADYVIQDIQEKEVTGVFTGQATIEKMESFAPRAASWFHEHFALEKEYDFGGSTFRYFVAKASSGN